MTTPAIMNGWTVKASDALTASIVAVWDEKGGFLCTGSVLPQNLILTAAHCIEGDPKELKIIFGLKPYDVIDSRDPEVIVKNTRRVIAGKRHENYNDSAEQRTLNTNDIALLKYEGNLPDGYRPAIFLPDMQSLTRGAMVTVAGYGVDEVLTEPLDPRKISRKKLEEGLENGEIVCDAQLKHCFSIEMNGDGVLRAAEAPISAVYDTEVRLDETRRGTCSGDSGGPAYIQKNGTYYLFGVTSRGSEMCDSYGLYTNALAHKAWLEKTAHSL